MAELIINILLPCIMGIIAAFLMFHPEREWKDGYETARKTYGNWRLGFNDGFKSAEKIYKDYDRGFGDGFESGWNAALENKGGDST